MRERIKTVILLLLVMLSLYLTVRLIFGQPYLETATRPEYEQVTFGSLKPLEEIIAPVIRLGEGNTWKQVFPWSVHYKKTWDWCRHLLNPSHAPEKSDVPDFQTGKTIEVVFPVNTDPSLWFAGSTIKDLSLKTAVYFTEDEDAVWYEDSLGEWWRSPNHYFRPGWAEEAEKYFAGADTFYAVVAEDLAPFAAGDRKILLPEKNPVMSSYTVEREKLDEEKLLLSFFVNMATVRRIEERDGAVIYTDGQKGLRHYPDGEFYFAVPANEPGTRYLKPAEILRAAAEYLHLMGGWPADLYLWKINSGFPAFSRREQRYNCELVFYCVQQGCRLVSPSPPVKILLSDKGIINYNRQILLLAEPLGQPLSLIDPKEALAVIAENTERHAELQVTDIAPVYFLDTGSETMILARPAWQVSFGRMSAFIDGFSGKYLGWLE